MSSEEKHENKDKTNPKASYDGKRDTVEHIATVDLVVDVRGVPKPEIDYGGICMHRSVITLASRFPHLEPYFFHMNIEEMQHEERHRCVRQCVLDLLDGLHELRAPGTFYDSYNPQGVPPWKQTPGGGTIPLELGAGVNWQRWVTNDSGTCISYSLQVIFEVN